MLARYALLVALCLRFCVSPNPKTARAEELGTESGNEPVRRLSAAHNRFGFELFHQISGTDFGENAFISPASVAFALAVLYNGAQEATKAEMAEALQLTSFTLEEVNDANALLLASLNESDTSVELSVANSIWCRNTFQFRKNFLDRTGEFYKAEIAAVDFDDPGSADIINRWVMESTRGKINGIIDAINPLDVMLLINAVYFKGAWTHPFAEALTVDKAFHRLDGTTSDVPMMSQRDHFRYLETEQFQAIRLPYGGGSFAMYVFLPALDYGLERFILEMNASSWTDWQTRFWAPEVHIVLPRLVLEYERSFNDVLKGLGMTSAFDEDLANLTGVWDHSEVDTINLYVSFLKQKTYLKVNEEGVEAAAVTAIGSAINFTSLSPPPVVEMIVDRPFFCAIVDDNTGLILFLGAIVDPS